MKKRAHLKSKKRKKINIINIIIILIITILFCLYNSLKFINKTLSPRLMTYAELEVKKISSIIINKAVTKHAVTDMNIENLFIITRNNNNEILTIDFNTVTLNKVLTQTTNSVQLSLKKLEDGIIDYELINENSKIEQEKQEQNGVILEIPSGQIFDNFLLNNLGPKIPVRLKLLGDIETNVSTKVTNYGINNALIEVFLDIKIKERVILPIITKEIKVETSVPIAIKIMKGTVPNYYAGTLSEQSPSFSIPLE